MEEHKPVEETNRMEGMPGVQAMHNRRFKIPGDRIKLDTAHYSEEARGALWWVATYCTRHNLSTGDMAAKLKKPNGEPYSKDSLEAALGGRREPDEVERIVKAILSFRRIAEEREGLSQTAFVETSLVKEIHRVCRMAFLRKKVTMIFGDSQIGKTAALEEYARLNNHGQTIMLRMPTSGALGLIMAELCRVLNISYQQSARQLRQRIFDCFDDQMLLIVDECHQCIISNSTLGWKALEFVREIHDRKKCGVVLCGTNTFRDGITRGPHAKILQQLYRRSYSPLQLPERPTQSNLNDFARNMGLDPAPDKVIAVNVAEDMDMEAFRDNPFRLQTEIITKHGLGRWLNILHEAADDARADGKKITWGRVLLAHRRAESISDWEGK